jgi:hypothetical protein
MYIFLLGLRRYKNQAQPTDDGKNESHNVNGLNCKIKQPLWIFLPLVTVVTLNGSFSTLVCVVISNRQWAEIAF